MQNPPTVVSVPPPFPFPPPPQSAGQVVVLPVPPPPFRPFATAPSSVNQITVLPASPQPPLFAGESSSVDLSPLEFLLALVAIVAIPALIYTFIFAYGCSSSDRRRPDEVSDAQSVASELSRHDVENVPAGESAGVKYQKEIRPAKISGECPVCLSVFADGEEVRELSVCKHSFHSSCIDLWLSNHSNCPICRTTVTDAATVKSSGPNSDGDLQPVPGDASSLV